MSALAGPDPPRLAGRTRPGEFGPGRLWGWTAGPGSLNDLNPARQLNSTFHTFTAVYFSKSGGCRHLRFICNVYSWIVKKKWIQDVSKEIANLKEFLIQQGKEIVKIKQENKVY